MNSSDEDSTASYDTIASNGDGFRFLDWAEYNSTLDSDFTCESDDDSDKSQSSIVLKFPTTVSHRPIWRRLMEKQANGKLFEAIQGFERVRLKKEVWPLLTPKQRQNYGDEKSKRFDSWMTETKMEPKRKQSANQKPNAKYRGIQRNARGQQSGSSSWNNCGQGKEETLSTVRQGQGDDQGVRKETKNNSLSNAASTATSIFLKNSQLRMQMGLPPLPKK